MGEIELIPDLVEDENDRIVFHQVKTEAKDLSGTIIEEDKNKRVPVTILTGYLGSGKSTLLEQIAKRGDRKLAVILNEFGDSIDIEKSLTVKDKNSEIEEWLDLGNGCLCCTVKDNGVAAIERLVAKRKGFNHIILETTGLADPGPITTMFWLDNGVLSNIYIDGVITVLDAENIEKCLDDKENYYNHSKEKDEKKVNDDDTTVAHVQIALADVILLNKIDRIENDPGKVEQVKLKVKTINSSVPIYETKFGDISLDKILELHAYETKDIAKLIKNTSTESTVHDHRMSTLTYDFKKLSQTEDFDTFEAFLQDLLWEDLGDETNLKNMEIHRLKGLVFIEDGYKVIQGVRKTYDIIKGNQDISEVTLDKSRLVIIGKYLNHEVIEEKSKKHLGFPLTRA